MHGDNNEKKIPKPSSFRDDHSWFLFLEMNIKHLQVFSKP